MKCSRIECTGEADYQIGFSVTSGPEGVYSQFEIDAGICQEHVTELTREEFVDDDEFWSKIDAIVYSRKAWHPDRGMTQLYLRWRNRTERRAGGPKSKRKAKK